MVALGQISARSGSSWPWRSPAGRRGQDQGCPRRAAPRPAARRADLGEADGENRFHPDEAVTGVIAAVFERFGVCGSSRITCRDCAARASAGRCTRLPMPAVAAVYGDHLGGAHPSRGAHQADPPATLAPTHGQDPNDASCFA